MGSSHVRRAERGIEERGGVAGERQEEFVEHGCEERGGALPAQLVRDGLLRAANRRVKMMKTLKSSKRHMEW